MGSVIFVMGMIIFPLPVPVPFGLPTMILGLTIMFKASNKVKRRVLQLLDKTHRTRMVWKKVKTYRRQKKGDRSA